MESVGVGRKSITLRNKIGKQVNLNTPTHYYVTDSYAPKALQNDKDTVPYETSNDWKFPNDVDEILSSSQT